MTEPVVTTKYGKIEGYEKEGLFIFKGVPYAAPPVGASRWAAPKPPAPWPGVRKAVQFAPISHQDEPAVTLWRADPQPMSEDCLYLNIWTPGLDDAKRSVMVWIHGGAFTGGSGSGPGYNGRSLATRGNTVVVTINYRLGLLGFLNLNEITGGKIKATGNEGLLDQIAALHWVHDSIAAFGGDPGNVTIFGESAGGMSVGCLMAMPGAVDLFHKAIPQSGAASTVHSLEDAAEVSRIFLDMAGVQPADVKDIRNLDPKHLLSLQAQLAVKVPSVNPKISGMPLQPVVDGKTLPNPPLATIQRGACADIPVLVGSTLEEHKLFATWDTAIDALTEAHLTARLGRFIPAEYIQEMVRTYRKARQARGEPSGPGDIFSAIQTDRMFRMPAILLADVKSQQPKHAFHYIFTWKSPALDGKLGACHAIDVPFVWGSHEKTFSGEGPAADLMSARTQDAWLAFARTGDPSCESLGKWPYYGEARETMMLGEKCYLENDPYGEERKAWGKIPVATVGGV